jgi:hypothetical protein
VVKQYQSGRREWARCCFTARKGSLFSFHILPFAATDDWTWLISFSGIFSQPRKKLQIFLKDFAFINVLLLVDYIFKA